MPTRRTEKQVKRFSMANPGQLPLGLPEKVKAQPLVIPAEVEHICPSCDIGAHEHCTGNCDCCGK